jgi:hypothetical protein
MNASLFISSFRTGCTAAGRLCNWLNRKGHYLPKRGDAIASREQHRAYVLWLLAGVYGTLGVSFLLFLAYPQGSYYRAYEYFEEVVYPRWTSSTQWDGLEKGDLSRKYLVRHQESWHTHVSCDEDGFRSVPFASDSYDVLCVGDSFMWGSGLSDNETLPWRLARELNASVFNAACSLESVVKKPDLQGVKLVVEEVSGHSISGKLFREEFDPAEYQPRRRQRAAESISLKRYFLMAKLFRGVEVMLSEAARSAVKKDPVDGYLFRGDLEMPADNEGIEEVVLNVVRRGEKLGSLGFRYMIVFVPPKEVIYGNHRAYHHRSALIKLVRRLQERGVDTLDLVEPFLENKDLGLYFKTDSHWNATGANLAARLIAGRIRHKLYPVRDDQGVEMRVHQTTH